MTMLKLVDDNGNVVQRLQFNVGRMDNVLRFFGQKGYEYHTVPTREDLDYEYLKQGITKVRDENTLYTHEDLWRHYKSLGKDDATIQKLANILRNRLENMDAGEISYIIYELGEKPTGRKVDDIEKLMGMVLNMDDMEEDVDREIREQKKMLDDLLKYISLN